MVWSVDHFGQYLVLLLMPGMMLLLLLLPPLFQQQHRLRSNASKVCGGRALLFGDLPLQSMQPKKYMLIYEGQQNPGSSQEVCAQQGSCSASLQAAIRMSSECTTC